MQTYKISLTGLDILNTSAILESENKYSLNEIQIILSSSCEKAVRLDRMYDSKGIKIDSSNKVKIGIKEVFYSGIEQMVREEGFKKVEEQRIIETGINSEKNKYLSQLSNTYNKKTQATN